MLQQTEQILQATVEALQLIIYVDKGYVSQITADSSIVSDHVERLTEIV